jgi:hypothetical protein
VGRGHPPQRAEAVRITLTREGRRMSEARYRLKN